MVTFWNTFIQNIFLMFCEVCSKTPIKGITSKRFITQSYLVMLLNISFSNIEFLVVPGEKNYMLINSLFVTSKALTLLIK